MAAVYIFILNTTVYVNPFFNPFFNPYINQFSNPYANPFSHTHTLQAIQAFYDQSEDMHQINNYLTEVQRSAQGWSIGFSLLANENTYVSTDHMCAYTVHHTLYTYLTLSQNDNIYFFASGILKYKVFHNWLEYIIYFMFSNIILFMSCSFIYFTYTYIP